jgi:hypothetical protein
MKRTPILEPAEKSVTGSAQERAVTVDANPDKYVETGRSVFDNLQATKKQVISLPNSIGPTVLSRSLPKSFEELREWLRLALEPPPSAGTTTKGGFGFTVRDVAQFQLKFLQYLTSCEKRRGDYGHITWLEFLGGEDAYSEQFVSILNNIPEALVAMDARVSDARTQGSVFAQLMLDNVKPDGYRDGTLVGPTSVAWLTPWRRYLEAQGVEFIHGKIVGFKPATGPTGEPVVWPDVECYEPRYLGALKLNPALMPGYFVLALPAVQLQRVARSFCDVAGTSLSDDSDIRRAAEFLSEADREGIEGPLPTGALRHMVGIQFYFDEDIYWRDGHFYLPMSKWGISAISQVRFWQDKHDWEHGYRGVLSVVFTVLERDGATLWQLSPEAIAEEIWERIRESLGDGDLPHPRYWHMDFGFRPKDATNAQAGYDNQTPMLINIPGQWDKRPGDLIPITDEDIKPKDKYSGYKVEEGVVLAGTMMKTYTRLTTMEAANESGRHAVNAILQHAQSSSPNHYTPCDIWPVELHEIDDLAFLKEVDAELYARRLDHFIEILDLDKLIRNALRGDRKRVNDPLDPLAILSQLDRILKSLKSEVISVIRNHKVVP